MTNCLLKANISEVIRQNAFLIIAVLPSGQIMQKKMFCLLGIDAVSAWDVPRDNHKQFIF